jgi:hypothetical protein
MTADLGRFFAEVPGRKFVSGCDRSGGGIPSTPDD